MSLSGNIRLLHKHQTGVAAEKEEVTAETSQRLHKQQRQYSQRRQHRAALHPAENNPGRGAEPGAQTGGGGGVNRCRSHDSCCAQCKVPAP